MNSKGEVPQRTIKSSQRGIRPVTKIWGGESNKGMGLNNEIGKKRRKDWEPSTKTTGAKVNTKFNGQHRGKFKKERPQKS